MSKHVGRSVRIFWANDQEWFHGVIDDYHPDQGWHCQYFDGDEEWLTDLNDQALVQFEDGGEAAGMGDTGNVTEGKEEEEELLVQSPKRSSPAKNEKAQAQVSSPAAKSPVRFREEEPEPAGENNDYAYAAGGGNAAGAGAGDDTRRIVGLDDEAEEEEEEEDDLEAAALAHAQGNAESDDQDEEGPAQVQLDEELIEDPSDPNVAFDLPERGVIMMGHVTNASNLPAPPGDESDGRVFFRILYVEGGSKSTMFRCKTPVYTSKEAHDLTFPEWKDGEFRFEMVMPALLPSQTAKVSDVVSNAGGGKAPLLARGKRAPPGKMSANKLLPSAQKNKKEADQDQDQQHPLVVQGEILVALYRARAQGGSDFIGQVSFDLAELAASGTTQYPMGAKAGAGVQARSAHGSYPIVTRSGAIAGDGMAHVDVALELVWRPDQDEEEEEEADDKLASLKGRTPVQSNKKRASAPKEKPKFKTFNAKRKLMEAHRIEKENKTLAAALKKHATKGQNKYRSVDKAEDVYAIPRENLISGKDPEKARNADEEELHQYKRKASKMTHAELMSQYITLKREVAKQKTENKDKAATLSRLKLHTKKYGIANDKMRRKIEQTGGQIAKGQPYSSDAMKELQEATKVARLEEQAQMDLAMEDLNGDGVVDAADASEKAELSTLGGVGYAQYLAMGDKPDLSNVDDFELREHLTEHVALQEARALLVKRIQHAKQACQSNLESLKEARNREKVARQRLGSAFSKLGNKYAGQSGASGALSEEDRKMDEDLQAIERVRGVTLELARTKAMFESGVNIGAIRDSIEELGGIEGKLNGMIEKVRTETTEWKMKKSEVLNELTRLQDKQISTAMRQQFSEMREKLLMVCRRQKTIQVGAGVDGIELEALRIQLRRQQKEAEMEG